MSKTDPKKAAEAAVQALRDLDNPKVKEGKAVKALEKVLKGNLGDIDAVEMITTELATKMAVEKARHRKEVAKARQDGYEDAVNANLKLVGEGQSDILAKGLIILANMPTDAQGVPDPEYVSAHMDFFKLWEKIGNKVVERALGKPVAKHEVSVKYDMQDAFAEIDSYIIEGEIVEEIEG